MKKKNFLRGWAAGAVTVILLLAGCENGTTDSAKNTPTAADYNISGLTQTYDGSPKTVTVTPKTGKSGGTVTVKYNGNTAAPSAAGTYTVTFDVAAAPGWNAASGLSAGTLTIGNAAPGNTTPTAADYDISGLEQTYDGSPKTVTVTPKTGKSGGTVTVKYNGNIAAPSAVGTYTVTFDVAAAPGWNAASGLSAGTLTIENAAPGNITPTATDYDISGLTQTYDGSPKTVTVTPKAGKSGGTVTVKYNDNTTAPSAAGTYTVTFDVAAATNFSAATGLNAGTLTIGNATPTAADYDISGLTQTYDGGAKTVTVTPKEGKSAGAVTVKYNGDTAKPSAAGTYAVTFDVAAAANFNAANGLGAGTLTISALAPVAGDFTVEGTGTFTYDGSVRTVTVTPKTGKSTGTVTVKYGGSTTAPSAAGTYAVTFDVAAAGNFGAANGLSAGTLTINKAAGAAVSTPTLSTKTADSITVDPVTASTGQTVEYARNTANAAPATGWQTSTTFTGLNGGTTYYIFARAAENGNYAAGAASGSLAVTTLQTVSRNRFEYYWVDQHGSLVTTSGGATTIGTGATLTITAQGTGYDVKQWRLNGLDTEQSGNTYSFSSSLVGTYTVGLFVEKDGKLYNTNIVITVTPRTVKIDLYDSGGNGWGNSNYLRINVNGGQVAVVNVSTTAAFNNPSGQRNTNTYTFTVVSGDVVEVYLRSDMAQQNSENSFIVYYADTPPSPAFTASNNNSWSGSNALVYRLRDTMNNIKNDTLLGSFTAQ
jgi:hypothetical protein